MLKLNQMQTHWFIGIGLVLQLTGMFAKIGFLWIVGTVLCVVGCCIYAKGKGYHVAWGVLGVLNLLGIIVLVSMRDKRREATSVETTRNPEGVVCSHCKAVLPLEDNEGNAMSHCPACGNELGPSRNILESASVFPGWSFKKLYVVGGLAIMAVLCVFVTCHSRKTWKEIPNAITEDDLGFIDQTSPDAVARKMGEEMLGPRVRVCAAKIKETHADILLIIPAFAKVPDADDHLPRKRRMFKAWMDDTPFFIHLEKIGDEWQATGWRWLETEDLEVWWNESELNATNLQQVNIAEGMSRKGWKLR